MTKTLTIDTEFFANEAEVAPLARLLYAGLWMVADREGRLEERERGIKTMILPYDDCEIGKLLIDLSIHGLIKRYPVEVAQDQRQKIFIQIVDWTKHNLPHATEPESTIPPCEAGRVIDWHEYVACFSPRKRPAGTPDLDDFPFCYCGALRDLSGCQPAGARISNRQMPRI